MPPITTHACERFEERYAGLSVSAELAQHILDLIAVGRGLLLRLCSDGRERWRVTVAEQPITVVLERGRATIVTALPPPGWDAAQRRAVRNRRKKFHEADQPNEMLFR